MPNKLQLIHREPTVYPKATREQLSKLYMAHLCNFDKGSVIERYLPFYQYGREKLLKQSERDELWESVHKFVRRTELRHFRLLNQPEDFHMERILAFYELTKVRWNYSPGWICKAYMTAFSEIEALLQCRRLGIALDEDSIMEYKKWYIKHFVEYFDFRRKNEKEGITFNTWYFRRKKSFPTKAYKEIWDARTAQLEALINRCPSFQIYGFKSGKSLDEFYEREYECNAYNDAYGQDLLEESSY